MEAERLNRIVGILLVAYLLILGVAGVLLIIVNFPAIENGVVQFPHVTNGRTQFRPFGDIGSADQGLIVLAFVAGLAGSFLHAAQSLSSYLGNVEFKTSWTAWYFLRPWVGGVLGFAIYFAFRAGLVAGASVVNPYGVVALGLLGGWFSKTTTDKLQEVFETLFKTDEDRHRKDKLTTLERPVVEGVDPDPLPAGSTRLMVLGRNFVDGAVVILDGTEFAAEFITPSALRVDLGATVSPSGTSPVLQVKNPAGLEPLSKGRKINIA